jgi:hypothetical protein
MLASSQPSAPNAFNHLASRNISFLLTYRRQGRPGRRRPLPSHYPRYLSQQCMPSSCCCTAGTLWVLASGTLFHCVVAHRQGRCDRDTDLILVVVPRRLVRRRPRSRSRISTCLRSSRATRLIGTLVAKRPRTSRWKRRKNPHRSLRVCGWLQVPQPNDAPLQGYLFPKEAHQTLAPMWVSPYGYAG